MNRRRTDLGDTPKHRRLLTRARFVGRRSLARLRHAIVYGRPHGYVRAAASGLLDRWKGLDTSGVVRRSELGLERDEEVRYEPSAWRSLRRVLRADDVSKEDVFLDIGSGKGRVLFEAAQYPFKRLIGVEQSAELNEITRRNFARHPDHLRAPIEMHTADAISYEIPSDVTVLYLYNPFVGSLFRKTVENLMASVDRHPRTVRVICRALAPREQATLESTGRFRLEKVALAPRPSLRWARRAAMRLYILEPDPA